MLFTQGHILPRHQKRIQREMVKDGVHRLGSQFGGAGKLVFCEGVGEVEDEHGGYFSK